MCRQVYFTLLGLISLHLLSYGQQGFKTGYVIQNNSDTLRGLVRYYPDNSDGLSVEFKKGKNQETQVISVNDLLGFGKGPFEHYEKLDLTSVEGIASFFFSRTLVLGERMSLYKIPKGYIILKEDDLPVLLANVKKAPNEAEVVRENTKALGAYITDCTEPILTKANGRFNQRSLEAVTIAYNECFNASYQISYYDVTSALISFEPFAALGFLLSTPKFEQALTQVVNDADYKTSKSFTLGVGTIIRSPKFSKSTGFVLGVEYRVLDYYGSSRQSIGASGNNVDVFINTQVIRGIIGIDLTKKLNENWFYVQGGFSFSNLLNAESTLVIDNFRQGPNGTLEIVTSSSTRQLVSSDPYRGLWFNFGVKRNINENLKLGFSISYERLLSNEPFHADFNNVQLSVTLSH